MHGSGTEINVRWTKICSIALGWAVGGFLVPSFAMAQAQCPAAPQPVVTSSQIPADVCIPAGFNGNPIAFFDDYSWRAFIAVVWPVLQGQRGVPDPNQTVNSMTAPRVFETYKADWEVFQPQGAPPTPWNELAAVNPCNLPNLVFGDLLLSSYSKFDHLRQAGFGSLAGPLLAQNGTYVRFLTAYNRTEFDPILQGKWFLRANLNNVTFASGAVDVKSAWIEMTNIVNPSRFYTRQAWVFDLQTNSCTQKTVGLVGLHIVQKTPSRAQWIWSTFEQVDNVPPTGGPATFNNGNPAQGMPASNPLVLPPPMPAQSPFNVVRVLPIHPSTQQTNAAYQQTLKSANANSVWQFYQLTMTQWPKNGSPGQPGTPDNTTPGFGATTAFANTVLETFDQKRVQSGCMNCHNLTGTQTDFLWSLDINAFPPTVNNVQLHVGPLAIAPQGAPAAAPAAAAAKQHLESLERLKDIMRGAEEP